jgi:hypothetical protein
MKYFTFHHQGKSIEAKRCRRFDAIFFMAGLVTKGSVSTGGFDDTAARFSGRTWFQAMGVAEFASTPRAWS